jgi:hypothetical protein
VFTARYGLYLCVLWGSQNKQRLFIKYFKLRRRVYCAVRAESLNVIQFNFVFNLYQKDDRTLSENLQSSKLHNPQNNNKCIVSDCASSFYCVYFIFKWLNCEISLQL